MFNNRVKSYIFGGITIVGICAFLFELVRPFFGDDFYGWEATLVLIATIIFAILWRNYRRAVRLGNIYGRVYRKIW